ncbi:MAG: hypothetical protein IJS20_01395, partial [Bacteroidales bacterium]|nr:hypothetical protein [Bacteroidales bacterium]
MASTCLSVVGIETPRRGRKTTGRGTAPAIDEQKAPSPDGAAEVLSYFRHSIVRDSSEQGLRFAYPCLWSVVPSGH